MIRFSLLVKEDLYTWRLPHEITTEAQCTITSPLTRAHIFSISETIQLLTNTQSEAGPAVNGRVFFSGYSGYIAACFHCSRPLHFNFFHLFHWNHFTSTYSASSTGTSSTSTSSTSSTSSSEPSEPSEPVKSLWYCRILSRFCSKSPKPLQSR